MKKIIITMAIAASAYATAQAQGLVIFNNATTTKLSTNSVVGGAASGVISASSSFYFALFYSATATNVGGSTGASMQTTPGANPGTYVFNAANSSSWTQVAAGTNTTAGKFQSAVADINGNTTVAGLAVGSVGNFVVLGWSANLGTSVSALENSLSAGTVGFLGESVVGSVEAGDGVSVPVVSIFGGGSPYIQGFTVGEVVPSPEPGTLALAALGGASLLMFRRKNK